MLTVSERPRELRWYHAAGLLFGDWGTSRLYVLGLAVALSGHSSFWYVAAMCLLVTLVGFSYTIVCNHFPDGGGVYSAAKRRSNLLAVIGALLLIANYVVTAALSAYEGFRYILPNSVPASWAAWAAVGALLVIGAINVIGPRRVGMLALLVAVASALLYLILGAYCLPHLGAAQIEVHAEPIAERWSHFINVILALSGVEVVANMTGILAEPVGKNARKAILVVLLEVVVLNLIMAYALNALDIQPATDIVHGSVKRGYALAGYEYADSRDHMVKILAEKFVGPAFAGVASFFFGLLLLSAANTAIGGMISVQYLLGRDKEMPASFTSLNRFGVPWLGLITAVVIPIIVLLLVGSDTETLAGLYAIGVVGAIAINLCACGTNRHLDLSKWERWVLLGVGGLVVFIELTIAVEKPHALLFAVSVLASGLILREAAKRARIPVPAALRGLVAAPEEKKRLTESALRTVIPLSMPRLLIPTRGHPKLMKFAINYAKEKKAALFILFVREVALPFIERGSELAVEGITLANDKEAQKTFLDARQACEDAGVPMVQLYAVHHSPAEIILDHAATLGVDSVIMGVSKRGALWKTLKGDVLQEVISYLPESISLLIHA